FYIATIVLWAWGGYDIGLGWPYQAGIAVVALHLAWQLYQFDLQRPERSLMLFRANLWTGVLLIAAALAGTLLSRPSIGHASSGAPMPVSHLLSRLLASVALIAPILSVSVHAAPAAIQDCSALRSC